MAASLGESGLLGFWTISVPFSTALLGRVGAPNGAAASSTVSTGPATATATATTIGAGATLLALVLGTLAGVMVLSSVGTVAALVAAVYCMERTVKGATRNLPHEMLPPPRPLRHLQPLHSYIRTSSTTSTRLSRFSNGDAHEQQFEQQEGLAPLDQVKTQDLPHVPALLHPVVHRLLDHVMRDFVRAWHVHLLPHDSMDHLTDESERLAQQLSSSAFPRAVEASLLTAVDQASRRLQHINLERFVTHKLLPLLTQHISSYRQAEITLHGASPYPPEVDFSLSSTMGEQDDWLLAKAFRGGTLHPAVSTLASVTSKPSEMRHCTSLVERILCSLLPAKDSASSTLVISLRDILTGTLVQPVLDMLSDPDFINQQLSRKATHALQEQHMVDQLRQFIDIHVDDENKPNDGHVDTEAGPLTAPTKTGANKSVPMTSKSSPNTVSTSVSSAFAVSTDKNKPPSGQNQFDALIQSINSKQSLVEVRQIRNDLETRQRQLRRYFNAHKRTRRGAEVRSARIAARRIHQAVKMADQRIAKLGGGQASSSSSQTAPTHHYGASARTQRPFSLDAVLHHSTALSYFMEFEERRGKSPALQFWLAINTFKDPLETIDADVDKERGDSLGRSFSGNSTQSTEGGNESGQEQSTSWTDTSEIQTLLNDLQLCLDEYTTSPAVHINPRERKTIQSYLQMTQDPETKDKVSSATMRHTCHAVLRAQAQVYMAMREEDWPAFTHSELYHQARQEWSRTLDALPPPKPYQLIDEDEGATLDDDLSDPTAQFSRSKGRFVRSHPVDQRVHADLFGRDDEDALFGQTTNDTQAARKTNLDYLTAIQPRGHDGRSPLFSDNLFGDTGPLDLDYTIPEAREQTGTDTAADTTLERVDGIERMDAIQTALESLILSDNSAGLSRGGGTPQKGGGKHAERRDEAGRPISPDLQDAAVQKARMIVPACARNRVNVEAVTSIRQLAERASRLVKETELLDDLLHNVHQTGSNQEQVRVIQKSQRAVARELATVEVQRQQAQERRTSHASSYRPPFLNEPAGTFEPGLVQAKIHAYQIRSDSEGRDYALYLIEVQLLQPPELHDLMAFPRLVSGWIVQRRYSEFWNLHQSLKDSVPAIRALEGDFPPRRLAPLTSPSFLDSRRAALERYLERVLTLPKACRSSQVRAFLAREQPSALIAPQPSATEKTSFSTARNILDTFVKGATGVAEGLDELINPATMFDAVLQQLSSESPLSVWAVPGFQSGGKWASSMTNRVLPRQTNMSLAQVQEAQLASTSLVNISDLFIEIFELQSADNWLRRQAVVIVLQQILAGPIQRKVGEALASFSGAPALTGHFGNLIDTLWPGGKWRQGGLARSAALKAETREKANEQISALVPGMSHIRLDPHLSSRTRAD